MDPEEDPEVEDWDLEVEKAKIEKADPYCPRLQPISQDRPISMTAVQRVDKSSPSWTLRVCGDSTEYLTEDKKSVCYGAVVVRSLQWPGAFTIYSNG